VAKRYVSVCDAADQDLGPCEGDVQEFRIWVEGERTASALDLCERHAGPIRALMSVAAEVELPSRPRQSMQVTRLRTTDATRHLKKKD
jgi:hypothetical protein